MRTLAAGLLLFLVYPPCQAQGQVQVPLFEAVKNASTQLYLSQPDSAIQLAERGLQLATEMKAPYEEGMACFLLAKAHWVKTNYLLSTKYGYHALRIFEQTADTLEWGSTLLAIGRNLIDLRDFEQAEGIIHRAGLLGRDFSDSLLAETYREHSLLHQQKAEYDSAMFYAERGLELFSKYNDTLSISILYSRKARILFLQNRLEESRHFNEAALRMDSLINNRRALGVSLIMAGEIAASQGDLKLAAMRARQSLQVNESIGNLPAAVRGHELLLHILDRQKKTDEALAKSKLINQMKDSLFALEKNGQVLEMQALYELEAKERTIAMLEKENELERQTARNRLLVNVFLAIGLLLLGALAYIFWSMRQMQKRVNRELAIKNQDIELQNEEIQSQAEALYEINQLKSKILSVVSHDLRSPIANLHALLELVTRQMVTPEEFKMLSDKLKSSLSVTQRTLENLLNWSLGQMEGIRTERTVFNIHAIIEDVAHLSEETASQKQINLQLDSKMPLFVEADVNQVHLILRNLFHNAIKFSRADDKVTIRAEVKDQFGWVIIEDQGIGMTQAEVDSVLLRNEYFTRTGTAQEKGTGLGLLLCKDFVKRNGGQFLIASKKGKGTTVSFSLPLAN